MLVFRSVWLVDVVDADPFLTTLVELDEDGVMRVGDSNATFTLVDDRFKCLKCGLGVDNHRHLLVEELCTSKLLSSVVREEIGVVLRYFKNACNTKAESTAAAN